MIKNNKIKAMFNNETEINCMFKRLTNAAQLFMCQNINIIMINVINKRTRFFDVCEIVFININNITISIFVFVMKCSDHELLLKKIFQRVVCKSSINMNDKSFEMILYSLNKKKQINFLKIFAKYVNNKEKKSVFAMKVLDI